MTDLDPRTAPWRAVAGLALLRAQVQALADTWETVEPLPGDWANWSDAYAQGAADMAHVCASELRELGAPQ